MGSPTGKPPPGTGGPPAGTGKPGTGRRGPSRRTFLIGGSPGPAPAVSLHRNGHARPHPAPGRRDHQERLQLQHGALFALPAIAALPGRMRRTGPDGVGGDTRLAPRRRRGVAGHRAGQRARHGDPGPQQAVGDHLGHQAQRDQRLLGSVPADAADREGPGRLAALVRGDGPSQHQILERGRLRVQRLRHQRGRPVPVAAAAPPRSVPDHRVGRGGTSAAAALPLDRSPGAAGPAGGLPRAGARHRAVGSAVRRAHRLGRVRLRVADGAAVGPERQMGRRRRRLPGGQARGRHLPVAGGSPGPARSRARVLLGSGERGSFAGARPQRDAGQQLRAGGSVHRR